MPQGLCDMAGKPTVLVIEDNEEIAYLLKFMLSREGFTVVLAPDGMKASKLIDEIVPPEVVVSDIMLPYMDGYQLIAQMRGKPEWRDVPIIMLTSKSQERDITRALEAGANDYIVKPFRPKELIARLRRFLK